MQPVSLGPVSLLAALLSALLMGCIGGTGDACAALDEEVEDPMELVTVPDVYQDGEGWALVVQCNASPQPPGAYRFVFETPDARTIVVEPDGDWSEPLVFYAPLNGTDEGDNVSAQEENPGNEGDPMYRITITDERGNGLVDDHDRVDIHYDAGAPSATEFDSPFESGRYAFEVHKRADGQRVAQTFERFEGAIV